MRLFSFVSLLALAGVLLSPAALAGTQNENGPSAAEKAESISPSGSTFVPLDSWVYPALHRLAALGFIPDQNSGLAPWTRTECTHQVAQAHELVKAHANTPEAEEALRLLNDLDTEFSTDGPDRRHALTLESVYTRTMGIGGTPLRDSYHFGQTIVDDFGRRYDSGVNNVTGFSGYGNYGRFFAYFRGEYQYAPGRDGYDFATRQFISDADGNPVQPATKVASTNRFDALETYVGAQVGFENISFGKESLWWGPGQDSAFAFSNNAEPFYMLNFDQSRPIVLPGILRHLGKIRTQFIFGELEGHQWPPRPLVNAQKVSFDLTDNLELGFTRSSFWGGVGHPDTLGSFFNTLFSTASTGSSAYGARTDPGDRHSGFDFRYRLPFLRRYVTVYSDSYADDDPNPLANPKRAAWAPGIYVSHLPRLTRLDLRLETYSTLLYAQDHGGEFIYFNNQYHDGYTNSGNLMGSWVGRDARAYVADGGYWISSRTRVQAQYRHMKQGAGYLPEGGTQTDGSVSFSWGITPDLLAGASVQFEHYSIPILGPEHENTVASLHFTYTPHNASLR
jgi:Capsule assembly protein Wzi